MRIEYLADHPKLVPELARLHFTEWCYLRPDETLEGRTRRLFNCCGRKVIPTVCVALDGEELCGSAMLVEHDMETRPELSPWLAGVYVAQSHRGHGLGSALIERITFEAKTLGVDKLYLYTPVAESIYARLGWAVIDRCRYLGANVAIMSKQLPA